MAPKPDHGRKPWAAAVGPVGMVGWQRWRHARVVRMEAVGESKGAGALPCGPGPF
jgi:hypothetical protein